MEKEAATFAESRVKELQELDRDFNAGWPLRNKGTPAKCSTFLQWRMSDYRHGRLHFPPATARVAQPKTYAAE